MDSLLSDCLISIFKNFKISTLLASRRVCKKWKHIAYTVIESYGLYHKNLDDDELYILTRWKYCISAQELIDYNQNEIKKTYQLFENMKPSKIIISLKDLYPFETLDEY